MNHREPGSDGQPPRPVGCQSFQLRQPSLRPTQPVRPPHSLTQVSANFIGSSMSALKIATELTGDNQTDVLNRSVQVYAYLMKILDEGNLIFVENPATGKKERLILL